MKPQRLIAFILCLIMCGQAILRAQDMDTELSKLTERLASQITDKGNKKVTVLDFSDLDGNSTELGKYLAEQLTVNFVTTNRNFAVLDRANLKKIMAEHQLTASGLVDPENAKKLGMFAGVDAMLFGTVVPIGNDVIVTVKIITTDTAEVIGGGKAKFQRDYNVQELISKSARPDSTAASTDGAAAAPSAPVVSKPKVITPDMKPFGDLQAKVESFMLSGNEIYGNVRMTLTIANTSDTLTYGLAMDQDLYRNYDFHNSRGDWVEVVEANGIEKGYSQGGNDFHGSFTDIPPGTSISISFQARIAWNGSRGGDYRPYHFQTVVFFCTESQGLFQNLRKYNLLLDIP